MINRSFLSAHEGEQPLGADTPVWASAQSQRSALSMIGDKRGYFLRCKKVRFKQTLYLTAQKRNFWLRNKEKG
jgi:hypothetical protein